MNKKRRKPNEDEKDLNNWEDYFNEKKSKLLDQFHQDTATVKKESDIFKDVAIFVNGFTSPSAEELKLLMAIHGGLYHTYQNSKTTHVIASNLPNIKIAKTGSLPIVKPSWISDSIDLAKLQDFRRYLLYTSQSVTQPALQFPTKTASDPNFLEEFYSNSRLHLISTLGSEFKQLVTKLRSNHDHDFPGLKNLAVGRKVEFPHEKIIMHIDMDCFFVSVGLRKRPELKGRPVAVTHSRNARINSSKDRAKEIAMNVERLPQRLEHVDDTSSLSEVASCSYEARKLGVRNGMFLGAAVKLCPDLKTIPYDFQDYREVSHLLYTTVASYTLDIEAVSCDEMYVDITEILNKSGMTVEEWATHIRSEILTKTACPCSTGFGANRLQARLATKKAKPAGQFYLAPEMVESYFATIPLSDLPGVGHSTLSKFKKLGLETCQDVRRMDLSVLKSELGSRNGEVIWDQVRGVDKRQLSFQQERKSVSAEINYGIRFKNLDECWKFMESLATEASQRLKEIQMKARCVTLKLMVRAENAPVETAKFLGHGICDCLSKSKSTNGPITDSNQVFKEVRTLFNSLGVDCKELRGVGIHLTKLEKEAPVHSTLMRFLKKSNENTDERASSSSVVEIQEPSECKSTVVQSQAGSFFKVTKNHASFNKLRKEDIDFNVVMELPEHIRNDLLKEYGFDLDLEKKQNSASVHVQENPKSEYNLSNLGWPELRAGLNKWTQSESVPSTVDVDMLTEYFRSLVIEKKLELLRVACNFLRRNLEKSDCVWHRVFKNVLSSMQDSMVACYGGTLCLNTKFECCD